MLPLGDGLILGINREGFLHFVPWNVAGPGSKNGGGTALYRIADAARWGPYTLAALFPFEGRAAALLYRDDFFAGSPGPLPSPRTFTLDPDSPEPRSLEIPAFGDFPAAEGWDLDGLRYAPDGYWYYRALRKSAGQPEIGYYRTRNLGFKGGAVSLSAFQNSASPEPPAAAPPLLRSVLEAAFTLGAGGGVATVVFSGAPGPRYFTGGAGKGGAAEEAETGGWNSPGFTGNRRRTVPVSPWRSFPAAGAFSSPKAAALPGKPRPLTPLPCPPGP